MHLIFIVDQGISGSRLAFTSFIPFFNFHTLFCRKERTFERYRKCEGVNDPCKLAFE
jgi:hypothetical protein